MSGKNDQALSAICTHDLHTINIRGKELASELIGEISFTDHFFFLLTGQMPSAEQRAILDATLVAIAEHGLVPSNQAARMTLAAAPDSMQGAVAAGILGCGSVVLGASEACGLFLDRIAKRAAGEGIATREAAKAELTEMRAARKPVPGYGHNMHREGDPRALRLLEIARTRGIAGNHVRILEEAGELIPEIYGRDLPINVSGAIPATLLDAGFPLGALKGIPILARTASLIAHLYEEANRSIGFILSNAAARAIAYDGPPLAGSASRAGA